MPLLPGKDKKTVGKNIATEIEAGRPRDQAIAMAMSKAGLSRKKARKKAAEQRAKK